jgi:hypothetical protein
MKAQHFNQHLCLFIFLHSVPSQKTFSAAVGRLKKYKQKLSKIAMYILVYSDVYSYPSPFTFFASKTLRKMKILE